MYALSCPKVLLTRRAGVSRQEHHCLLLVYVLIDMSLSPFESLTRVLSHRARVPGEKTWLVYVLSRWFCRLLSGRVQNEGRKEGREEDAAAMFG